MQSASEDTRGLLSVVNPDVKENKKHSSVIGFSIKFIMKNRRNEYQTFTGSRSKSVECFSRGQGHWQYVLFPKMDVPKIVSFF